MWEVYQEMDGRSSSQENICGTVEPRVDDGPTILLAMHHK